jgi:hypothetical protein
MKVVEEDAVVVGMLRDELARCEEGLDALKVVLSSLPKGSLHLRIKRCDTTEYRYHYLKFREAGRVVNRHVPARDVKDLQDKLLLRKRHVSEAEVYRKRIAYIELILSKTKKGGHGEGR